MSWRFALTLKWLVRHVLVVALVVAMMAAGFWQLRRLDDKRAYRDLVADRQEEPTVEVTSLLRADAAVGDAAVDEVLYRTVSATGTYVDDETVVVENRTFNGSPGGWVLTPLELGDGAAVVVNRGFIGFDRDGRIVPPPAPTGPVRVEGLVFPSQEREGIGRSDPDEGDLEVLVRADLERYQAQVDLDLLPAYVQLVESDPRETTARAGAAELVPLGAPEPDLGPHLGYAVQWFIFSTIAAGGYLLLLWRVARDRAREAALDGPGRDLDELDRELEELLRSER